MTTPQHVLDFYRRPATMTSGGGHARMLEAVPRDLAGMARVVQGLLLHEHWAPAYGVTLSDERRRESHIRPASLMLDRLLADGGQRFWSLGQWRRASSGSAATSRCCSSPCCVPREFPRAPVAGSAPISIPVASRITGSANTGMPRGRWALVDAQIDDVQRAKLKLGFDLLDAPRDRFVIAGDAWARCRARDADPATFGIFDMRGLWFIAGNLMRDLAALNNMEMLPWDIWGAMIRPGEPLGEDRLALFDRLSTVTRAPDAAFAELRGLYEGDDDLRVPGTVFNAVLNRPEVI